jgi:hypothetical protein
LRKTHSESISTVNCQTFLTVFILYISNNLVRLRSKGLKGTNTLAYLLKVSEMKNKVLGH